MRSLVLLGLGLVPCLARADGLIPGPGESGHDEALAAKADRIDLQIHTFLTRPLGFGLEATVPDPAERAAIDEFFSAGAADFTAHTGLLPYDVVGEYGESGDLGMFGGVQAAGDAFRYAALRDGGAAPAVVDAARAALLRAMDGLHWYTRVTGVPGCVARGLLRITPEPGDPPMPGTIPATVPLFDGAGFPQPPDKSPTWRDDQSGELPFLVWLDDSSKDQLDGYVYALGVIWDVAANDPTIPGDRLDRLVEDARAIGLRLLDRVEVAPGVELDLVMVDADGRPATFHDLSAEELAPGLVIEGVRNGFNAWMALGIVRTLFHITGDERIGRAYYDELVGARGYLDAVRESVSLMYLGTETNFSNVNMAFVAAYGLVRYESDPEVGAEIRELLDGQLYSPGRARQAEGLGQSFFDVIFAGFGPSGATGPGRAGLERGLRTLREHPAPPTWNHRIDNCDEDEIASRDCIGIDGTPLRIAEGLGRGGGPVTEEPVPMRIRPPSNFEWRDDPHRVNGGGGDRLNPAGDFHAAYWMGRFLRRTEAGEDNLSPIARPPLWTTPPGQDAGPGADAGADAGPAGDAGAPPDPADAGGCGCRIAPPRGTGRRGLGAAGALMLAGLWYRSRRGGWR